MRKIITLFILLVLCAGLTGCIELELEYEVELPLDAAAVHTNAQGEAPARAEEVRALLAFYKDFAVQAADYIGAIDTSETEAALLFDLDSALTDDDVLAVELELIEMIADLKSRLYLQIEGQRKSGEAYEEMLAFFDEMNEVYESLLY